MELTVTRRYAFRSVHALLVGEHRERRHGHAYGLEITCSAGVDGDRLDQLVLERVLARLHGRELGQELEPATGEVIVEWIDERLRASGVAPLAVCLQETRKNRFASARSELRHV